MKPHRLSHFLLNSIRGAMVLGAWLVAMPAQAQFGALEDRPYQPSESVVRGTVAALSDSSEEVVSLAIRSLGDWRQADAGPGIVKLLGPSAPTLVRWEALKFFARLGPTAKPYVPQVLEFVKDADPNIRAAVLRVVLQAGGAAENVATIAPLLTDARAEVREAAAKCLGQAGKAAESYRKELFDRLIASGNPLVMAAVLDALDRVGGISAGEIDRIMPLLDHRVAEVRIPAWTLVLHGVVAAKKEGTLPAEKVTAIRDRLKTGFHREEPEIQAAIIEDAGQDPASLEACVPELLNEIRTGVTMVRAAALRALGQARSAAMEHVPLIVEQSKSAEPEIRAAAIAALGTLGPGASKPNLAIIAAGLRDPSEIVRDAALGALPSAKEELLRFPYKIRSIYDSESAPVRATLMKAVPVIANFGGITEDELVEGQAAMKDNSPEVRVAAAFIISQLDGKTILKLLPATVEMTKDADASVRGAAAISLRTFASVAEAKPQLRAALRPLLKDKEVNVRWAVLDTLHEVDPGQDAALIEDIAAAIRDEDQSVRTAAVRALGAGGDAAKPYLQEIVRFFEDDPAVPPYAAAQAVLELSPLNPQELASLLHPLYVYAELQPITRLTAYGASGGQRDGQILLGLVGRSRVAIADVVKPGETTRAIELLQAARTAPLVTDALRAEIDARLAELKAQR